MARIETLLDDLVPRHKRILWRHNEEQGVRRSREQVRRQGDSGLSRPIAAEESITSARLHCQAEAVDRLQFPVTTNQLVQFDDWSFSSHNFSLSFEVVGESGFALEEIEHGGV